MEIIGISLIPAFLLIPEVRRAHIIFATADTYGIPLAFFKRIGIFSAPLIFNTVGLYDGLISKKSQFMKMVMRLIAPSIDMFVSGGSIAECKKLSAYLHIKENKFIFIPFGIDTNFFKPQKLSQSKEILIIGADPSRDWELYKIVIEKLQKEKFRIITYKGLVKLAMPQNTIFEYGVDYVTLRKRINQSKLVLVLSKMNYHFAGQSTAMRCMSCAKPVIFTKTPGVEEYAFESGKNCELVSPHNSNDVISAIRKLNRSEAYRAKIGKNAREIIKKMYPIEMYSKKLTSVFLSQLDKSV